MPGHWLLVSRASAKRSEPSAFEDQGENVKLDCLETRRCLGCICHSAHRQGATVWGRAQCQPCPHKRWKLEDEYPGFLLLERTVLRILDKSLHSPPWRQNLSFSGNKCSLTCPSVPPTTPLLSLPHPLQVCPRITSSINIFHQSLVSGLLMGRPKRNKEAKVTR